MALGYAIPNKAILDHVNISDINVLKYKAISVLEKASILWNGQDSSTSKPPSRLITKTLLGRFVYKKMRAVRFLWSQYAYPGGNHDEPRGNH